MGFPSRILFPKFTHTVLWFALIAVFLCIGSPRVFRNVSRFSIQLTDNDYHSSDIMLGQNGASKRLVAAFDSAPSSQPVIIFVDRHKLDTEFTGMLAAYLAWPHPTRTLDAGQFAWTNESSLDELHSAAAIVFCGITTPASWPQGEKIGNTVLLRLPIQKVATR